MLTGIRKSLKNAWRPAARSKPATLPPLSDLEQTKLSWAKAIGTYAAVPPVYQDFFEPLLSARQAFPYTVLIPACAGPIYTAAEKLICMGEAEIYILERSRGTFTQQCYPLERIAYLEFGSILLDAWVTVSGVTGQGVPRDSTFRFNSVTDYLLMPVLERIRLATTGLRGAVSARELEQIRQDTHLNLKFQNYARRSLLAGERVLHAVMQPEIRSGRLKLPWGIFTRQISPAHLSLLTDKELIVIREDSRWSGEGKYGGVWDYIPLSKIVSLSCTGGKDGLLEFSIRLPEGAHLDLLFRASARPELDRLIDYCLSVSRRSSTACASAFNSLK